MLNLNTKFGQNILWRLQTERIIWLTTISNKLIPQPRPVWFFWDEDSFLIYSKPDTMKLVHIKNHPKVSLHFDGDGLGGNIMVFTGYAEIDLKIPPAAAINEYATKYIMGCARIDMSVEEFSQAYSIPIRVRPTEMRGH